MANQVLEYIEKNKDRFLKNLCDLIKIESVSANPSKKQESLRCAELEVKNFKESGLENVQLIATKGNPLVYGDWLHAPGKPTILIYGHYDVQPPDPLDEWKTPPFEPTIKDGNLYARGTSDNKAQHFTYLCAIEAYLKTVGKLPINIKVILEGEEEIGSKGIEKYVQENAKFLSCDAVLVSDTPWFDFEHPSITYSLKGLCYFEVKVKGPSHDLHSGLYGGMVRNPLQTLSWILAKLKDDKERILIPNFYDDVREMTASEKKEITSIPFNAKAVNDDAGTSRLVGEQNFNPMETNWTRPTLDICGMWGGYQGAGSKTIIPAEAGAKVSIRVTANQDPKKVAKQFCDYVKSLCPKEVTLTVDVLSATPPVYINKDNFFMKQTAKAYEQGFGKKMIFQMQGASIPVTTYFQQVL
ncbi:MAG: hypothetical protein A3F82_08600, partial [Deltaproteobacteria bacterium RIFCSPLOWO2_12_FULL_44_12]